MTPQEAVEVLRDAGATVATAESLTGGLVVAALVSVPGASDVVRGGVVAYAADVKSGLLGVPGVLIAERGTVDEQVAQAMAQQARLTCAATFGVATTGVAGPNASEGHPPGTVHIAVAGPTGVSHRLLSLVGDRDAVRQGTVTASLELLVAKVREETTNSGR